MKKITKTSYLENYKNLSSHIQRQDSQPPEITLTDSNNRIDIFKIFNIFNFLTSKFFLKISQKIIKNVISRKIQGFEQSYWETKFATPESTLTKPHYRDDNFKFCEIFYTKLSEKI